MNRAPVALAVLLIVGLVPACQAKPVASGCVRSVGPTGVTSGCAPNDAPTSSSTTGVPTTTTLETGAPAAIDAALLAYLPKTVGGVAVREDAEEAAIAVSDATLSRVASAVDVGVAVDQANGDVVTAHVVRLREGAFDDATYRDWRDTFDEGACAAGGGVKGRAETTIDDRTVFVTTCVAPIRVYHAWIADEHLLVSASSLGSAGYGERLMSTLRLP